MEVRPIARRHHYLPQGYLAAFTDTGTKEGQLFALDVHTGRGFRTSPKNVAAEKDFNRVDIDGHPPDAIETALAPFEGEAVRAIRVVIETRQFPNDDDWNWILNLLGLIAVHNPQLRKSFNQAHEQVINRIGDLLVSDKKIWAHYQQKMRDAGEDVSDSVSFEDMKRFIEERRYSLDFHPQGNLRVEFHAFNELLPLLGQRTWSVLVAPDNGPELVCSDHPVCLTWKRGRSGPVGYGLRETEVYFPLGRRVGFYGAFENPLRPVVTLSPGHVATMNRRVALNAKLHVFSTLHTFAMWHEGQVREVACGSNLSVQPTPAGGRG